MAAPDGAALDVALNRFGYGARPDGPAWTGRDAASARAMLTRQLEDWQKAPVLPAFDTPILDQLKQLYALRRAAEQSPQDVMAMGRRINESFRSAVEQRMALALASQTPFVERLVHFWSNHFAISASQLKTRAVGGRFEGEAIRPHVLGSFADLLLASTRHPAMLLFLDQPQSLGPDSQAGRASRRGGGRERGLNENLAREIMELHTLGSDGGYSQADVTELARALTGWSLNLQVGNRLKPARSADGFAFYPALHQPGERQIMGQRFAAGGEDQAEAALRWLAAHPATARHVATKLARHFCADDPPATLVQRLEQRFLSTRGDLAALSATLIDSPEVWDVSNRKLKSPWDWAVSSLRVLGAGKLPDRTADRLLTQLAQPVWQPGSPAGWPDRADQWSAPNAIVRRVEAAAQIAARAGNSLRPARLAERMLHAGLDSQSAIEVAGAESVEQAVTLLLVSPQWMYR